MEKLKFALFSIVTLSLLGLFGYWAVVTLQSGTEHVNIQKIKDLQKENDNLKAELQKDEDEISALQAQAPAPAQAGSVAPTPTASKYQSLIDALQKLVDGNVFLKLKSVGGNVGTVQQFLNVYNNTSGKVDNDYGPGMVKAVKSFQKDAGLNVDGQAGKSTFNKMIDWLQNQK